MLEMPVEVVPIIIGALGTILESLKRDLMRLKVKVAQGPTQESVMRETVLVI